MSDMSWEHASEARAALNAIVADPDHGVAVLSNPQTMSNLLKDYLPDAPREKSILVAAAEAGLADTLRDHVSQGMDANTAIRLTASSFSSSTPFTTEACNWVTDELAVALGISQPRQPGSGQPGGGPAGGAPVGGGAPGSEGMPTRIAPIPGAPGAPGTPGAFGQPQPAAPGYRPGYPPGPQPGGSGQPPGQGYQGQQPQPYQGQPARGYPGQPGLGYQGQQPQPYQPQPYQGQQGRGYPAQPGTPGAWPPTPYQPGSQPKPKGRRRGLLVVGGVLLLVVIAGIIGVVVAPTTTVEPLSKIMNPAAFSPVATNCGKAPLLNLKTSTLTKSLFCAQTTTSNIVVFGYQFDSNSDYQAGLAQINSFTGFHKTSSTCPPAAGSNAGSTDWHAKDNPKYVARPGQVIECFIDKGQPVLIWTLPTMNVVFIARDGGQGDAISRVIDWWKTVNYG